MHDVDKIISFIKQKYIEIAAHRLELQSGVKEAFIKAFTELNMPDAVKSIEKNGARAHIMCSKALHEPLNKIFGTSIPVLRSKLLESNQVVLAFENLQVSVLDMNVK